MRPAGAVMTAGSARARGTGGALGTGGTYRTTGAGRTLGAGRTAGATRPRAVGGRAVAVAVLVLCPVVAHPVAVQIPAGDPAGARRTLGTGGTGWTLRTAGTLRSEERRVGQ